MCYILDFDPSLYGLGKPSYSSFAGDTIFLASSPLGRTGRGSLESCLPV